MLGAFDLKLNTVLFSGVALPSPIWMYELSRSARLMVQRVFRPPSRPPRSH